MSLQENIRKILREEITISNYVRRRVRCFDEFTNKLMSGDIEVPVLNREPRLNRSMFRIVVSAYMREYCDSIGGNNQYDPIITDEIMILYGEKLFKWYLKSFTS